MPILTPRTARSLGTVFILMLVLALTACSIVQIAYNQSQRLAYWQLNKAFDFNAQQSEKVQTSLKQLVQWHRQTQLPLYAQFANRAQIEALGPVSPELACERRTELEGWSRKLTAQALPMMAELVLTLSPEQLKHLEAYQTELLDDLKDDYLDGDVDDRNQAATKFVLKWAEIFYGHLEKAQRQQLKNEIAALPLNAQNVYDEVAFNQHEFLQLIQQLQAQKATVPQAEQALQTLFEQFFKPTKEPMRSQRVQWIASGCKLTSSLHEQTTPEQREKAAKRLRDWETDLKILTKQTS